MKTIKTEMETIKGNPSEMKTTISEMKSALEGINRVDETEDRITDRGWGSRRHPLRIAARKKNPKNEDNLKSFWDNIKHNDIHSIGAPEGEERARNEKPIRRNNDGKLH